MEATVSAAERLAYGRPVDLDTEPETIPLVERSTTILIARFLIAAIFIGAGINKLTDPQATIGYMNKAGIPNADVLVYVSAAAELLGGLAIVTGLLARLGALGLIVATLITTVIFHAFWNFEGAERVMQQMNFMKNLAVIGGLALLFAYGPGRFSIDRMLRRPLTP